jgi:hypothetical protein
MAPPLNRPLDMVIVGNALDVPRPVEADPSVYYDGLHSYSRSYRLRL